MLASVLLFQFVMAVGLARQSSPGGAQDAVKSLDETWTISGRVTDRETGQPLPRARVSAFANLTIRAKAPDASTTTDANGVYELAGLVASRYLVLAEPPPHVSSHLAQIYADDVPYDAADARFFIRTERFVTSSNRRDIDIALTRALAIEGRVVSDDGDPIAGLSVALHRTDLASSDVPLRPTDDRGRFRHFGLVPGRYRLCVSPPASADPASDRSIRRTCYPGIDQSLELASDSIAGLDIHLRRGKAATITGVVSTSAGVPLDGGLIQLFDESDSRRKPLTIERAPGGRLVIRGVEPGTYRLIALMLSESAQAGVAQERISLPVTVNGDVENLAVRTRPPATITGVVQFDDALPPKALQRLRLFAQPDSRSAAWMAGSPQTAGIRPDFSFQIGGMFEPAWLLLTGLPTGWAVKGLTYRNRDITDLLVEFQGPSDPHPVTIAVTNRVAQLTGRVVGPANRGLVVLVFFADPERWLARGGLMGRAMVKPDGTFQVDAIAPGDYLVAVTSASALLRSSALERLAERAQRVALVEGDRRELTLYASDSR